LILFVGVFVATPIICGGRPVAVPYAPHAPQVVSTDRDLDIYVYSDGSIFIDAKWYPAREFAAKLLEFGERASAKHIVLRAAGSLSFGQLRAVLHSIRKAGFTNLTLITFSGSRAALIARAAA
jgi:biopolymer transport protein ExbD